MSSAAIPDAVKELAPGFAGQLIQPSDSLFHDARMVHNGLIDKKPSLIAQCRGVADVADAVRLARKLGLEIAVRGGGHNVGGRGTSDGGLVIDLSRMKGVHVNPKTKLARAEGGVLWKEFNRETQVHGLATTGGVVGTTGVGGLTLGGGIGWLMAKHGLALDNLQSVELVTHDGSLKRAAADENPDLFWGVRGGGGNFGVATSLEFRLHPIGPIVTGGLIAYPIQFAKDVLKFFRDQTAKLSDDTFMVAAMLTAPDGQTKIAAMGVGYFGSRETGDAAVAPIKTFGQPILNEIGPIPYTMLNSLLDGAFPRGARNYWKSNFIPTLTDAAIDALIDRGMKLASPQCQLVIEHFHGAASRVPVADTAYALRETGFNIAIIGQWTDAAADGTGKTWVRDTYSALQPHMGKTRYLNYLGDDESGDAALAQVYGPNLARLKQVKAKYDPENVFRVNVNVKP
jgi:FAD/FMN-containing dehydrogenase